MPEKITEFFDQMTHLVVGLSAALHLKWLDPGRFAHAGPRLREDPNDRLFATDHTPDISMLCKRIRRHGFDIKAIIVFVDCFSLLQFRPHKFPKNIPVLAVIGDTHHGKRPITDLAAWLRSEQISKVALKQTVHHGHIFRRLGFATTLLPYYLHDQIFIEPSQNKVRRVLFCGSVSSRHKKRNEVIRLIKDSGVPLDVITTHRIMSFRLYNRYIATINVPLNMDINYRFHEVVASGGCLITERPCAESDDAILLERDIDYITFSSPDKAIEKIQEVLDNPKMAHAVAIRGQRKLENAHKGGVLLDSLARGLVDDSCEIISELEWNERLSEAARLESDQLLTQDSWR